MYVYIIHKMCSNSSNHVEFKSHEMQYNNLLCINPESIPSRKCWLINNDNNNNNSSINCLWTLAAIHNMKLISQNIRTYIHVYNGDIRFFSLTFFLPNLSAHIPHIYPTLDHRPGKQKIQPVRMHCDGVHHVITMVTMVMLASWT